MPLSHRSFAGVRRLSRAPLLCVLLLSVAVPSRAQDRQQQPPPPPPASSQPQQTTPPPATPPSKPGQPPDTTKPGQKPDETKPAEPSSDQSDKNRIFGVLPNYTSVEAGMTIKPITSSQSLKMAAMDSFDPMVYPLFGFIAAVGQLHDAEPTWGTGWAGYARRYGAAFADNTVCSLVTTGLLPSFFHQDPRYFQGRETGFIRRAAYAASRSLVTKSRTGHPQFNVSEIAGTFVVANVSNFYYPVDERNAVATLERWGTQAMWDTVANELKEFWPDIRGIMHGHTHTP